MTAPPKTFAAAAVRPSKMLRRMGFIDGRKNNRAGLKEVSSFEFQVSSERGTTFQSTIKFFSTIYKSGLVSD
jgi:hypothetical protein